MEPVLGEIDLCSSGVAEECNSDYRSLGFWYAEEHRGGL